MNTKIYVGNILYEITDQDLRELFSQFGEVVAAEVVRYQKSKRSKGFGFVRMATPEQAQAAIQALNDQDYRGRKLFLDLAKSEDPTPEVREKQLQAKGGPAQSFTPMVEVPSEQQTSAPVPEPAIPQEPEIEEVHPQVHIEPQSHAATPIPPAPPVEHHVPASQAVPEAPVQPAPQQPILEPEQPPIPQPTQIDPEHPHEQVHQQPQHQQEPQMRNFGTIFSNSPRTNEDQ